MRSNPKKPNPNKGKVALVLAILAIIWLVVGTLTMMKIKDVIINGTYEIYQDDMQTENGDVQDDTDDDPDAIDDSGDQDQNEDDGFDDADGDDQNAEDPGDADDGFDDDDDIDDYDDIDDDDDDDADDDTDTDDDIDDDVDDVDDNAVTMTVEAWDGFAAVRTGRGTNYSQVGKLNNGEKVKVTDLENGWYKIASGKWKGNYLHRSSLK